jgi:quercetin dioxygenase-like cupin family protein
MAIGLGRPFGCHISAVIVSIPPGMELPLHTHVQSDDFFIILKGTGAVVFEQNRERVLRTGDSVWVPAGCPHGLRSGPRGAIEVGFQCPPDNAPLSLAGVRSHRAPLVQPARLSAAPGAWSNLIGKRKSSIAVHVAKLRRGQTLNVRRHDGPSILLVVTGAAHVLGHALGPLSLATLGPATAGQITAIKPSTLLVRVTAKARTSNQGLQRTGRRMAAWDSMTHPEGASSLRW